MHYPDPPGPSLPQEAQHFLRLLDDVSLIQKQLLEERAALRARVQELEARAKAPGDEPAGGLPRPGCGGSSMQKVLSVDDSGVMRRIIKPEDLTVKITESLGAGI